MGASRPQTPRWGYYPQTPFKDEWDEAGLLSVQHIPKVLVARRNKRKSFACKELRQAPAVVL